jgi:hypothetical protein
VSLAELRAHRTDARELRGLGHNLHTESPASVVELLDAVIAHG